MTKTALVGFTGFVGSNLTQQFSFDGLYNSKNIANAFGTSPDTLIYSGVKAEKFLANKDPKMDYSCIEQAIENIKKVAPKKLVLISTIDVYKMPTDVDEDTVIDTENLQPYGYNRYLLEKWVEENVDDYLIVRLPGLYGFGLKKNFIYDMIHLVPSMLNEAKYAELFQKDDFLAAYYQKQDNGFYKCNDLTDSEKTELKAYFEKVGFSALNFTDSRASFQFYNLKFLWAHIKAALEHNIKKLNIITEPVTAAELYKQIKHNEFVNEVATTVPVYNIHSKYAEALGGKNGYLFDKGFVLKDIQSYVEG